MANTRPCIRKIPWKTMWIRSA